MKIVLATGGTGGHLFPALQTAREFVKEGHEVFFYGSFGKLAIEKIQSSGFDFKNILAKGLSFRSFGAFFVSVITMAKAVRKAFCMLRKLRPDVVAGFGGYGAFPVVLSAWSLRYPTLIHEQNVVPGKANAILAKLVKKIAISFPQGAKYFNPGKIILTGCPCNVLENSRFKKSVYSEFHLEKNKKTFFVLGGSQGSERINTVFMQVIPLLKKQINFQVIHISGSGEYEKMKKRYKESGIRVALFPFLDKIKEAYQCADLVISRAGAVTITEIIMARVPAVLIPYPHAGGHQKYNARVLCESGTAHMIEEKELSVDVLKTAIFRMINKDKKTFLNSNMRFPDATTRLAGAIKEIFYD